MNNYDIEILKESKSSQSLFCLLGTDLFQHLANHIKLDINIYGIYVHEDFDRKWTTIEDVNIEPVKHLNHYVNQYYQIVNELQQNGPFHICGYSFGGYVAIELAKKLKTEGKTLGIISMLDTIYREPNSKLTLHQKLLTHLQITRRLGYKYPLSKLKSKLRRQKHASDEINNLSKKQIGHLRMLARHKMAAHYIPSYDGHIHLFRATEHDPFNPATHMHGLGWDNHVSNLVVHKIPGNHSSILKIPNVALIASKIEDLIHQQSK